MGESGFQPFPVNVGICFFRVQKFKLLKPFCRSCHGIILGDKTGNSSGRTGYLANKLPYCGKSTKGDSTSDHAHATPDKTNNIGHIQGHAETSADGLRYAGLAQANFAKVFHGGICPFRHATVCLKGADYLQIVKTLLQYVLYLSVCFHIKSRCIGYRKM